MGFFPILAPALDIHPVPARVPDPAGIQAVLVSSANALPGLSAAWHILPLFTVGTATAARARAAGFADIRDADADAAALAALVAGTCRPVAGPLLLLAGQGQGMELAKALRAAGFRVIRRVVYAARPIADLAAPARAALAAGQVGHALFFSAATALAFLRQLHRADMVELLCHVEAIAIGQPARVALQSVPWRRIRVASRPTQDAMLACLRCAQ